MSGPMQAHAAVAAVAPGASNASLLDTIIEQSRVATNDSERLRAHDLIGELVDQVLAGAVTVTGDLAASIDARIAEIDALLSAQLNEILHEADFQALEASWRGLKHLVDKSETGTMLKLKVLNVSKTDLAKDFRASADFDQSALFKKIYEEEYGTFGGAPYAALLGDYAFSRHPEDLYLLEQLSHVAAAAHAPFLSAAAPTLFGIQSFADIGRPRDLAKIFDTVEYAKWKAFRDSEDARYTGLVLPRVLGRLPYGAETCPVDAFDFEEDVDGTEHDKYLWTNAVYAYAARLTEAFAQYGWLAAIRGVEGGGLVDGLPAHTFRTDEGEVALKCPTEVAITDRSEKLLADLGFISLVHCKNTDYASFFSHRGIALFHGAWRKYRHWLDVESGGRDGLTRNVLDLAGLGFGRVRETLDFPGMAGFDENFFIRHAGLLAQKPLSASAVESLIGAFTGVPAELVQFVGQWIELPLEEQTRLGRAGNELGCSTFIGSRLWDRQTKVQLRLGPMRRERFEHFLPGGRGAEGLEALMRFAVGFGLACDATLILDRRDVPEPRLAADTPLRLGGNVWLAAGPPAAHPDEMCYRLLQ